MRVTQQLIADRLGLTQSTVARILNKNPRDTYSQDTVKRVLDTARELGYTINHKRTFSRKCVNIPCRFELKTSDKAPFSSGTAVIRDISRDGLALSGFQSDVKTLPLIPFFFELFVPEAGLADFKLRCEPIRIGIVGEELEIGLRFVSLQKKRLKALREAFQL